MEEAKRDHLFISYATEDSDFAEWIALRLSTEGYKVWCDRTKLLGGESYPKDIDHAIKNRTFRLLALLSHSSIHKVNPLKERTLALNIARARNLDFLIPLNIDGLSATELDWMTSDLTFIPFHYNWASGFSQLLKKLEIIETPRDIIAGRISACNWIAVRSEPIERSEMLHTNLLPILEIPKLIHKFELKERVILPKLAEHWPYYNPTNSSIFWAFNPPPSDLEVPIKLTKSVVWQKESTYDGLQTKDISLALLRKAITQNCIQRGMLFIPRSRLLYFPEGLFDQNYLRFRTYDGKKRHIKAVGERTFKRDGQREKVIYHLAPTFNLNCHDYNEMTVRIAIQLHFTNQAGLPLESTKVISRRKYICKNWWNHEWLSRFLAIVDWFCEGQSEYEIFHTSNGNFRVRAMPLSFTAELGIDETEFHSSSMSEKEDGVIDVDVPEIQSDMDNSDLEETDNDE